MVALPALGEIPGMIQWARGVLVVVDVKPKKED